MGELDDVTQRLLSEHESALQQQLSDARRTTENAIRAHSEHLATALSEVETRQTRHIQTLEQRLASAAAQAERLSRAGGIRSWTRPLAITFAVMIGLAAATAGGLLLTDRLIDSRIQTLMTLRDEIQRAESLPRLPQGVEIRTIQGESYLVGVDPNQAFIGTINDGQTPVIGLTRGKED
ncbi:hypothetical protein [uncultured Halomonas sp.]|uniref:hypothetical protein n=1 Tax=uncultured Halomonas sp. TaxID=173971 RepID=UPI002626B501|nr:hypothetical protein [uncultured Halomonas sp.]